MKQRLFNGWLFHRGEAAGAEKSEFDDSSWQRVNVPHDWAITGPFDKTIDVQNTCVKQDGETKPSYRYGRTGALPHVGIGWYRLHLKPDVAAAQYLLEFDGVMSHSKVWVNGQYAGGHIFGYAAFRMDITKYFYPDKENCIAVRVDNPADSSRWYPGAGIFRDVFLYCNEKTHFEFPRIHVQTLFPDSIMKHAELHVELFAENFYSAHIALLDPDGKLLRELDTGKKNFTIKVDEVLLWSPESPRLYRLKSVLLDANGKPVDELMTSVGFRKIEFSPEKGMILNGECYKLKGVCMHHDLGALGAAFNRSSMIHQLKLLKSIGCNAIRTSHNPPASALLDLCDEMGFVVMDEAFDVWIYPKTSHDYSRYFEAEHGNDLRDFMLRDRNHPCVIFWSLGNEIDEQGLPGGPALLKQLIQEARQYDSRPLTCGMHYGKYAIDNHFAEHLDLCGWNYKPQRYADFHRMLPEKPHFGSETVSVVSSRGVYKFPVKEGPQFYPDGHCNSYDLQYVPWAQSADQEFLAHSECPWIFGEFVWTGFDYLGEPSPYNDNAPFARSSYFGIFDLAALPKDRVWLYRAAWTAAPMIHVLPHWNWSGRIGEITPVHAYTNAVSAELFVNGKSAGIRKRRENTYRIIWDEVTYEPGTILVIAYGADGKECARDERRTSGEFAAIKAESNLKGLESGEENLAYLTITLTDAKGIPVPTAENEITVEVSGAGTLKALCNGDQTSLRSFYDGHLPAFSGMLTAIVSAGNGPGIMNVKISADNGITTEIHLSVKDQKQCTNI